MRQATFIGALLLQPAMVVVVLMMMIVAAAAMTAAEPLRSFGVVMWELLTLRPPWEGMDPFQLPVRYSCFS